MWGWSLETWEAIAYWTLLVGAILGGAAVALTAFSSWVTIKTSAIIQREADQKIAEAKERGDEAHEQASKADERAATASKQAEAARLEQEKIRKENLELSIALEKEQADRLKLEGKLASRHLTQEQRIAIIASLKAEGSRFIIVTTKLGDREAGQYADELIAALEEAGAFLTKNVAGTISPPIYGVIISPREDTFLSRALDAAKIPYTRQGGNLPGITVGLKPPAL
jgi:hypothetical protein